MLIEVAGLYFESKLSKVIFNWSVGRIGWLYGNYVMYKEVVKELLLNYNWL